MKRVIGIVLGLAVLLSLVGVGSVQAMQPRHGERVEIAKDEIVDSTVYIAGTQVSVEGTVKGDLFCAGQEVTITGTVEGDVLCAAQNVRISGVVQGDVRVASQFALLSGKIDGSATVFAQTATLEDKATIGKDLSLFGQNATIAGSIGRDAVVGGEMVTLSAKITRDIAISSEDITLRNTTIGRNLTYISKDQVKIAQNTVVIGETQHQQPPVKLESQRVSIDKFFTGSLFWFGAFVLIGSLLLAGLASFTEKQAVQSRQKPWLALGLGLLVLITTPFIAGLLLVTIIGIPLSFVLIALWLSALTVSLPLASYTIGQLVTEKLGWSMRGQRYISLLIGVLLLIILSMIPFVGGLVIFMAMLWGLGSIMLALKQLPAETHQRKSGAKTQAEK